MKILTYTPLHKTKLSPTFLNSCTELLFTNLSATYGERFTLSFVYCYIFVYYKLLTSHMRDVISTSTSLSSHSSSLLIPSLLKQRSYVRLLVSNIAFKLARRDSGKTKLSRLGTQGTKPSQTLSSIICLEIRNLVETHFFLISR